MWQRLKNISNHTKISFGLRISIFQKIVRIVANFHTFWKETINESYFCLFKPYLKHFYLSKLVLRHLLMILMMQRLRFFVFITYSSMRRLFWLRESNEGNRLLLRLLAKRVFIWLMKYFMLFSYTLIDKLFNSFVPLFVNTSLLFFSFKLRFFF